MNRPRTPMSPDCEPISEASPTPGTAAIDLVLGTPDREPGPEAPVSSPTPDYRVLIARARIDAEPWKAWTAAMLAAEVRLSCFEFSRKFNNDIGMSVPKYREMRRVKTAKLLLLSTCLNTSEIAAQSGFFDKSHLCRAFKLATRTTPQKYRKRELAIRAGRNPAATQEGA